MKDLTSASTADLLAAAPRPASVPITVLCGFLGAGKTTLLNQLLSQQEGQKIAVIVNEFGAVNIDASLVVKTDETITELSNGCICCTLRGDLLQAVDQLLAERDLDAILIESTGIGEPLPIAQSFCLSPAELELDPSLPNLLGRVHVDAMITVVDAAQFFSLWNRPDTIEGDEFGRGFGELLAEQLEFADIVVLNKVDIAAPSDVQQLRELIALTNPRAQIMEAERGQLDARTLLNVQLFDQQVLEELPAWGEELQKEHIPESEEFGLSTFVYRQARPLDVTKLHLLLRGGLPSNIIRSKGWVRFADDDLATLWNHTGKLLALEGTGYWADPQQAVTEVVFIGQHLDDQARQTLTQMLDSAVA